MHTLPVLAAVAAVAVVAGCSSGPTESATSPTSGAGSGAGSGSTGTPAPSTAPSTTETHSAPPGAVGVSPAGVTTAVGAPATSTEEEYAQACSAAKEWMTGRGGDPKAQFEPYLADVQRSNSAGPGTFGTAWGQLPPDRQAAVIVAAEAAADGLC